MVGMVDCHVVFVWQAWSPFNFGSDVDSGEKDISVRSSCKDFVSPLLSSLFLFVWSCLLCQIVFVIPVFQELIQNMNKGVDESEESDLKVRSFVCTLTSEVCRVSYSLLLLFFLFRFLADLEKHVPVRVSCSCS